MQWLLCPLAFAAFQVSSALYLETFVPSTWKVVEDTDYNLTVSLRLNSSDFLDTSFDPKSTRFRASVAPDEAWKLDFQARSFDFTLEEVLDRANKSVVFSGYYWGRTQLSFYLVRNDLRPESENGTLLKDDLFIIVDRQTLILDYVFIALGSVFMLFNNVNMGTQLDVEVIIGVLRRPLGPICGFVSQFVCMPVVSFFMGWLVFSNPLDRLGLFTLGCCPGGTMSNFWTLMFNGDINLSITMTAVSTMAAMAMMPLWMFTLGEQLLNDNNNLQIPFGNLAGSLVSLTVPVIIGMVIKYKRPEWAAKSTRIIKPFTLGVILFFMTIGLFNSYKAFMMMTWQMPLAGVILALCGYTFGAAFAKLWCLSRDKVIAISIETALQNAGVAFILLKLSLPSPDSDLAALPVVATMMMTGPPLIAIYFVLTLLRRFTNLCDEKDELRDKEQGRVTAAFLSEAGHVEQGTAAEVEQRQNYTIVLEGLTKKKLRES